MDEKTMRWMKDLKAALIEAKSEGNWDVADFIQLRLDAIEEEAISKFFPDTTIKGE